MFSSSKPEAGGRPTTRKKATVLLFSVLLTLALVVSTHFNISGPVEGIFLLKGKQGSLLEIKNDLYLGDGSRLLLGIDFGSPRFRFFNRFRQHRLDEAYLYYEWDKHDGTGYVRNFMPGGRQLLTCFARYEENNSENVNGLLVGGGLPDDVKGDDAVKMNETGMAYFDGKRWYHIWCSVNEAISSGSNGRAILPSRWKFLGSKVLKESEKALAITSRHEIVVDNVPLRMDRYAYFRAGDPYFILSIRITNMGKDPVSYFYLYGDEPWVGNYGTSAGNVGWVRDGLVNYVQWVNTDKYSYIGMYDHGNSAIGESGGFTDMANFIEWFGNNKPADAYFSNNPNDYPKTMFEKVPLSSNERFMGLQWGPLMLQPGQSDRYVLAIGKAGNDPKTGFPVKPPIKLEYIP